jgi:hypothetical protein
MCGRTDGTHNQTEHAIAEQEMRAWAREAHSLEFPFGDYREEG